MKLLFFVLLTMGLVSCSNDPYRLYYLDDGAIVKSRIEYTLKSDKVGTRYYTTTPPNSTINLSYNLTATNVGFTLNANNITSVVGDDVTLGSFSVASLDDNRLRLCPTSGESGVGTQKCTFAAIRVRLVDMGNNPTDGLISADNDGYSPLTITNSAGAAVTVGSSFVNLNVVPLTGINRLKERHFNNKVHTIKTNTDNSGAGFYSVKLIVEYVLYK